MSTINPATALRNATALDQGHKTPSGELDKDAFLRLMVGKLRNQDPLNPTDDNEFMAQLAQMTSMEQLQNMALSMQVSTSFGLLGKTVSYNDPATGNVAVGAVEKVVLERGVPTLQIGGVDGIAPSAVVTVQ